VVEMKIEAEKGTEMKERRVEPMRFLICEPFNLECLT